MSFKTETTKRLMKLEIEMETIQKLFVEKDREISRLVNQNNDLMNRFMATKWEQYALNNPEHFKDTEQAVFPEYSPITDESNIGRILNDEELGK